MTKQALSQRPPGPAEYSRAIHYGWEVDCHVAENEFLKKQGRIWNLDERKMWLSRYFSMTPYVVTYETRQCPVCSDQVATAMLEGNNPWAAPPQVKGQIKELTAKLGTLLGVRKRHIDLV